MSFSAITEISSPERVIRLFALEEAIQQGAEPAVLEVLQAQARVEDDEECRALLEHAIRAVSARISPAAGSREPCEAARFQSDYQAGDRETRLALLTNLSPSSLAGLGDLAPEMLTAEPDPRLKALLIKTLGAVWPEGLLSELFLHLRSETTGIFLAAFQVLVKRVPNQLVTYLPTMLHSPDLRMQNQALRALTIVDREEALNFAEEFLFSGRAVLQKIALANGFHLPFDRFKEKLFKLFAISEDQELLRAAGDFFLVNPDPEIPFRLLETLEKSSGPKAELLKELIRGTCQTIQAAGILEGDFDAFWQKLQETVREKHLLRNLRRDLTALLGGAFSQGTFAKVLRRQLEDPAHQAAITRLLTREFTPEQQQQIKSLLYEQTAGTPSSETADFPGSVGAQPAAASSLDERVRRIAVLQVTPAPDEKELLRSIFQTPRPPLELLVTAVRTARIRQFPDFVNEITPLVKHPEDGVIAEAVEYLGLFRLDILSPHIGQLLKIGKPRIKSAVLETLRRHDAVGALRLIQLMIKDPQQRQGAIEWMVLLDFSLVRDTLTELMQGSIGDQEFDSGLVLFRSNPAPENLYSLYCLAQKLPPASAAQLREARQETVEILFSLQLLTNKSLDDLEKGFAERFREAHKPRATRLAARGTAVTAPAGSANATTAEFVWGKWAFAGVLVMIGVAGWWFSDRFPSGKAPTKSTTSSTAVVSGSSPVNSAPQQQQTDHLKGFSTDQQTFYDATPEQMQTIQVDSQRRADLMASMTEWFSRPPQGKH
jgi:hypothetical protein